MLRDALNEIQTTNEVYDVLNELVSDNCGTGAGLATKHKGWEIIRTKHLDAPRSKDSDVQRDAGYTCAKFVKVVTLFLKHKRITISTGKYNLMYKENKYFQEAVIAIDIELKKIKFVTIMQLNLGKQKEYRNPHKERRIFIGVMK